MPINEYDDLVSEMAKNQGLPVTPQPSNTYDEILNEDRANQKTTIQQSMFAASQASPEQKAKVLQLSDKMKLPPSFVEKNFDELSKEEVKSRNDYDSIIDNTPGLAKWLENPDNAALGQDDLDSLSKIDHGSRLYISSKKKKPGYVTFAEELGRAGKTGLDNLSSAGLQVGALYGLTPNADSTYEAIAAANKRSQDLRNRMPDYAREFSSAMEKEGGDVNKAFSRFTNSFDELRKGNILEALKDYNAGRMQTAAEVIELIGAAAVRPKGLLYSSVENLANSIPSLLTGAIGAKVGSVAGPKGAVAGFAGGTFVGSSITEIGSQMNEAMIKRGLDITNPEDIRRAYSDPELIAQMRGEAQRKGLTTALVDSVFSAVAGKFLQGANVKSLKSVAGRTAADIGVQATGETASEFAGQVAREKGDLSKVNVGESIQEGILSLGHSVGDTTIGASLRSTYSKDTVQAATEVAEKTTQALETQHNAQVLVEVAEAVKESKVAKRIPDKIKELVNAATEGAESSTVLFQTDDWDSYWSKKGLSPIKAAEQIMGDNGKSYLEAKNSGTDLEIPLADYVAKVADTEDFEGLLPSARTEAGGMTLQEANEHMQSLPATLEELSKEATAGAEAEIAAEQTLDESSKEVGKNIQEQLKAIGEDPKQAIIHERAFRTLGERLGVPPLELFNQYKLLINKGELSSGGNVLNQARDYSHIDSPQFKKWFGKSKVSKGKKPIIVYHGTTGDFSKFDQTKASPESDFGAGFYFTNNKNDVSSNYAGEGPDLKNKIERLAEQIASNEGIEYKLAEKKAREELSKHGGVTIPVYLSMQNPLIVGGTKNQAQTNLTLDLIEDENGDIIEEKGTLIDFIQNLRLVSSEYNDGSVDNLITSLLEEGGELPASLLYKIASTDDQFNYYIDDNGNLVSKEILRKAIELTGFDGIIDNTVNDKFGTNRQIGKSMAGVDNKTTHYIVFKPEQIKSAIGNRGTFDPGDPNILNQPGEQTPRGQIALQDNQAIITIGQAKDPSTFFHESGHYFLEVMGKLSLQEDSPQQIKDDFKEILNWLGVESKDQIKTEHHEKWARGFEAFIMEGKAPSQALRKAFAKFKIWLTSVYRQLRNLNVELTPEIRNVMSRMLATDEEIAEAQGIQNQAPLFVDPKSMGMSDKQTYDYLDAVFQAEEAAKEELNAKILAPLKREQEKWYKDQRKVVREEVAKEVNQQPIYKVIDKLRSNTAKISRDEIKNIFGKDVPNTLPAGILAKSGEGIHPNIVAEGLGFQSSSEMVSALTTAQDREKVIDQMTDSRMEETYPDLMKMPELSKSAMDAIHNDKRALLLRKELEHLASNNMPVLKEAIRRIARRVPSDKLVKAEAQRIIGRTEVSKLRPILYQRAEAKAAKEAGELLAKGDINGAFEAKKRELLNHELYRAVVAAQENIAESKGLFKKIFKKDESLAKSRDMDLVNAARAVLSEFGLGKTDNKADHYLKPIAEYSPDTYETIKSLVDSAIINADDFKNINYDDFLDLKDAVEALWDLSKTSQQIEIDGRIRDIEEVRQEIEAKISERIKPENKSQYDRAATFWDKAKMYLLGAKAAATRVGAWAEVVDGKEGDKVVEKSIARPVQEGTTNYRFEKLKLLNKYLEDVKLIEKSLSHQDIVAPELVNKMGQTKIFSGKAELLGAMLHTGNESNLSKLLRGRGWGSIDEQGNLDSRQWNAFVDRMHKEGVLVKADYDYLQSVWDMFEELKPQLQKAHKQMYGHYFSEVTANEFETPFGKYRGGYVPAKVDPFASEAATVRQDQEALKQAGNNFTFPTTGRGSTKKRNQQYAAPLLMDLSMVPAHIDWALRFIHIEPRVKQVSRLVMNNSFRQSMRSLDPTIVTDMLVPWLQRSASQKLETLNETGWFFKGVNAFARALRTRTGLNVMAGNITNAMQQVTGLSISKLKVDGRFLRDAMISYMKDPKKVSADIVEESKWMATRLTASTIEIQQNIEEILLNPSKYDKARDYASKHGYFLQVGTQNIVDVVTYIGAREQAIENGLSMKEAILEANDAVRKTQGAFNPEDVSRFETGSATWRLFNMFSSYFNMQANLLGSQFANVTRDLGMKKQASELLYIYSYGFMIPAVVSGLIVQLMSGKGIDEDDDDQYMDDVLSLFFGSQFRTATAMLPIAGPVINASINRFNDVAYDDRISTSPAISMLESAGAAPSSIFKATFKDGSKKSAVKDTLSLLGLLTGLPVAPAARPIGYLIDVSEGNARPENPLDFARGLVTGKSGEKR